MKRIISLILSIMLLASLCSCGAQIQPLPETTTEAPEPEVTFTSVSRSQEFKDENGRTVYIVDAELPSLSLNGDTSAFTAVNARLAEVFDKYAQTATSNIKNAAAFMDARDSDKPWCMKIRYQEKYVGEDFVSLIYRTSFSMYGSDTRTFSETFEGCTVNMKTAEKCAVLQFAVIDFDEAREKLAEIIVEKARKNFYTDGSVTESQLQTIANTFNPDDFWYDDGNIVYFLNRSQVVPNENLYYECTITPEDYAGILDFTKELD